MRRLFTNRPGPQLRAGTGTPRWQAWLAALGLLAGLGGAAHGQVLPVTSGLRLYLKADAGVTSSGGTVSAWADQSGNGFDATQATVAAQPELVAASNINGRPALRFNVSGGTTDFLNNTSATLTTNGSPNTVFMVGRTTATGNGGSPFTSRRTNPILSYELGFIASAFYVYSDGVNGANNASTSDLRTTIRSPFISTYRSVGPGNTLGVTVNGTARAVSQGSGMAAESGAAGFTVGTREDLPNYAPWVGDYAELIVYDRALTAAEQTQVETYLSNKYGITTAANTPSSAPTLTAVTPARNAASATRSSDVTLTFSEALSSASASATALKVFGSHTGLRSAAYSGGGTTTLTINPTADFRAGERVDVTVTQAAQSSASSTPLAQGYVSQFVAAAGAATGTLAGGSDLSANRPVQVGAGDFDGDGDLDLMAANYQGGMAYYPNNGSGSFGAATLYNSGLSFHSVSTGDLDGDGDLDVAAVQYGGSVVYVYLNSGNGTFVASTASIGGNATDSELGDLDGDGDLDLVTANYTANSVSIRLNNGSGVFSGSTNLALTSNVIGVALADFDQDGDLDLAATRYNNSQVYVYLNAGGGVFPSSPSSAINTGSSPYYLSAGDIDNDGFADLAIACYGSASVMLAWGSGTGTFTTTSLSTGFTTPVLAGLGDLDGDGDLDLAISSYTANNLQTVRNQGSRSFATPVNVAVQAAPYYLTLADLNNDNALDLATANYGNGSGFTVSVRLNTALGVPTISGFTPTSGTVGSTVTVSGTSLASLSSVSINGTAVTSYSSNAGGTQLTLTVPTGATTGLISVTNASGTGSTSALATPNFTVLPSPTITSFTPTSARAGMAVTITGSSLTAVTGVLFGGVPAASFLASSGSSLTATPAAGGASGVITLIYGSGQTVSSAAQFSFLLPNVTRLEYYIDADPGFGSGTSVPLTPSADVAGLGFGVSLSSLSNGFHRLSVRSKDGNGAWSQTYGQNFYYEPLAAQAAGNIVRAEYFLDTDPGFGAGINVPVGTPATDVAGLAFSVNLSSLASGFHRMSVRTRDADGRWSQTYGQSFYYEPATTAAVSNIVKAEYFLDTDPGFGAGVNVPIATPATDVSGLAFGVNLSSLAAGFHRLYVRTRDANGKWSLTTGQSFYYEPLAAQPLPNIVKAEYFLDTDPGFGAGINVPIATPLTDVSGLAISVNLAALSTGFHQLGIRSRDASGRWSLTTARSFYYEPVSVAALSNIVKLEYFLDTDPGFGAATNVPIATPGTDLANIAIAVPLGSLSTGFHTMQVRSRSANGKWSLTTLRSFYYEPVPAAAPNIVRAEYFFDTDPGFGLGTAVAVPSPAPDVAGLGIIANASALADGQHTFSVRTRDASGRWSLVTYRSFTKNGCASSSNFAAGLPSANYTQGGSYYGGSAEGAFNNPAGSTTNFGSYSTGYAQVDFGSTSLQTISDVRLRIVPQSSTTLTLQIQTSANLSAWTTVDTYSSLLTGGQTYDIARTLATVASNVRGLRLVFGASPNAALAVTGAGAYYFNCNGPTITSFTPTSGAAGTTVVITGTNLTGVTSVNFNGTAVTAGQITGNTGTSVTVVAPAGGTSGQICLTATAGSTCSAQSYAYPPVIVTGTVAPTAFCASTMIQVPFTTNFAGYAAGNQFGFQLSDASGNFTAGSRIYGHLTYQSGNNGVVSDSVALRTPAGSGYRVRVVATNPATTGSNNGVNLTIYPTPVATAAATPSTVAYNGSINLSAGPLGQSSYQWYVRYTNGGTAYVGSGQTLTLSNAQVSQSGRYFVYVTNSNSCQDSASVRVTVQPSAQPILILSQFGGALCAGTALSVGFAVNGNDFGSGNVITAQLSDASGSFAAPVAIGSVGFVGQGNSYVNATIPTNTPQGSGYRIRLVGSNPSLTSAGDNGSNLTINALPAAVAGSNSPVPYGGTIQLTAQTVAGATYQWYGPNFYSTQQNPTIANATTGNNQGTYQLVVTTNGCPSTATTNVVVSPSSAPILTFSPFGGGPYCAGATSFNIGFNVTGNSFASGNLIQAQLSDASGSFGSTTTVGSVSFVGQGNGVVSVSLPANTPAGTAYRIRLVGTSPGVASQADNGSNLTINAQPAAAIVSNNSPVAYNGTVTLTAQAVSGATYLWNVPGVGNVSTNTSPTLSVSNATPSNSGTYTLTVTANGCSNSTTASVTVSPAGQPIVAIAQFGGTFCAGAGLNIGFSVSGASFGAGNTVTAQLSNDTGSFAAPVSLGSVGFVGQGNGSIAATIPANTVQGGLYRIRLVASSAATFTPTDNGQNISISTLPAAVVASNNSPVTAGGTITLTAQAVSGASYQWFFNSGLVGNAATLSIANAQAANAGTYTLTVTLGSCPNSTTATVVVNTPSAALATGSFGGTFCPGSFVSVPFTASGFNAGNTFTAQLSNASGSFASPTSIGSVSGTASGSIAAQIPVGTAAGNGYRIRVVASSPATTASSDNGSNLVVGPITYTWTGAVSSDWFTAANWSCGQVPTSTSVVTIPVVTGPASYPIVVGGTALAYNLTIVSSAQLTVNSSFSLYGNVTVFGSMFAGSTSTWSFAGIGNQYVYGTSAFQAGNVIIGSTSVLNANNYLNLYGNWTNNGGFVSGGNSYGVVFNGGGISQCVCGSASTSFSNFTVSSGAVVNLGLNTAFSGNVVVNGTFNAVTYGVVLNGTTAQQLGGVASGTSTFYNITISNLVGVTLADDITVLGDWINDGVFSGGSYSVIFAGTVAQIIGGSQVTNFYNISFQNAVSVTLHQNIYVLGSFHNTGVFYGYYVVGGVTNGYFVRFGGSTAQVITANATTYFYHFYVDNAAGVSLATNIYIAGNYYLYSGSFAPGTFTCFFNGTGGYVQTVGGYTNLTFYGWNIVSGAYVRLIQNVSWLGNFVNAGTFYGYDLVGGVYTGYTCTFAGTVAQVLSGAGLYEFWHLTITNNVAGGLTFSCPAVYVFGNWLNNGVFFCGTSTVYFGGTLAQLIGGSSITTFYHVSVTNLVSVSLQQNIYVLGNWSGNGRFFGTGYYTFFNGTTAQTIFCASNTRFGTVRFSNPVSVTLLSDIYLNGNWTHDGGFVANGYTVYFTGSATQFIAGTAQTIFHHLNIATGATVQISRNITLLGNWLNNGTFLHNSLLVYFNGTVAQLVGGSAVTNFYDVTFNNAVSVTLNQHIYVLGNFINSGVFYGYNGPTGYFVRFAGTAQQVVNANLTTYFYHFYADNAAGVKLLNHVYIAGNYYLYSGSFLANGYTCYFNGTAPQTCGGYTALTFYGWNIASGATLTLNQHCTLQQNFVNNGVFHCSSPYVFTFGGSVAQALSGTGTFNFWHVTWNNLVGITLNRDINVLGDWSNLGGFIANGYRVVFGGTATQFIGGTVTTVFHHLTINSGATVQINRTITLLGDWLNNGSFLHNSLLVYFNGTVLQTIGGAAVTRFYDVTFNNPVNVSLGFDIDVVHNFINNGAFCGCGHLTRFNGTVPQTITCTSGHTHFHDLTFANSTGVTLLNGIYVSGLWVNNGGYLANSQLVIFDGTALQTIGGSVTSAFYNVGITNAVNVQLLHDITVGGSWNNTGIFTGNGYLTTFNGTAQQTITTAALPAKTTFHHVTWANALGCVLAGDVYVKGNWLCNGPFNPATWTVYFNGTTAQTCGGSSQLNFHGLSCSNPAGVSYSSPVYLTGNFANTGLVNCGPYAWYCTGSTAQTLGGISTTPTRFYDLVLQNASGVSCTDNLGLTHVLTLTSGNLASNGHLTLHSDASGTAMVVNPLNGGEVTGQATMERFITGLGSVGYRHYSSPMKLSAAGISTTAQEFADDLPVFNVNPAYNTVGTSVTPFPTLFKYDESRITTGANNYLDYGYLVPGATEDLQPLRGYSAMTDPTTVVDIRGLLQTGNVSSTVSRSSATQAGWQLLGNPYPAPMDWDVVRTTPGMLTNVAEALYVFQPSGRYTGSYKTYVNGIGQNGGSKDLAAMQGYYVRATGPGSVSLTNAVRATTYLDPAFSRAAAGTGTTPRPLLRLAVAPATQPQRDDETVLYFEAGAALGFSPRHDAYKVQLNADGRPTLWSVAGPESFAINGLPDLATAPVVPLGVRVTTTGSYVLSLNVAQDLPAGTQVWLEDRVLNRRQNLAQAASYAFTMDASYTGQRFFLNFVAARPTAVTTGALEARTALYPNPTTGKATLELSGLGEQGPVAVEVVNVLGQPVRKLSARPHQGIISETLDLSSLPAGVYTLRIHAQEGTVVKRLVRE